MIIAITIIIVIIMIVVAHYRESLPASSHYPSELTIATVQICQ